MDRADGGQIQALNISTPEQCCPYDGTCSHMAGWGHLWVSLLLQTAYV